MLSRRCGREGFARGGRLIKLNGSRPIIFSSNLSAFLKRNHDAARLRISRVTHARNACKASSYTPSMIQLVDAALLDSLVARARNAPRLRLNHNFHSGPDDNPSRFLNALIAGTYVVPHRHCSPPKAESFLLLRGEVAVLLFDDHGTIAHVQRLGMRFGTFGIDLSPGVWHSLVCMSESAVLYEVKAGPWRAATDKEFASWAPPEQSPEAQPYLAGLLAHALLPNNAG